MNDNFELKLYMSVTIEKATKASYTDTITITIITYRYH